MGVVENITYDRFPKQGRHAFQRAEVMFHFDPQHKIGGTILRDDAEEPWVTIIALVDGRLVLSTECQYRPMPGGEST